MTAEKANVEVAAVVDEEKVVYENEHYKVVCQLSPHKYQRFTRDGKIIDSSLCYGIINKATGVLEDEQLIMGMAITNANQFGDAYNGLDAQTKSNVKANNKGRSLIQH